MDGPAFRHHTNQRLREGEPDVGFDRLSSGCTVATQGALIVLSP